MDNSDIFHQIMTYVVAIVGESIYSEGSAGKLLMRALLLLVLSSVHTSLPVAF